MLREDTLRECEVIGIRSNRNGGSCAEHKTCGHNVRVGDVLVLRPVEIPKRFGVGMEEAIRAAQFRGMDRIMGVMLALSQLSFDLLCIIGMA